MQFFFDATAPASQASASTITPFFSIEARDVLHELRIVQSRRPLVIAHQSRHDSSVAPKAGTLPLA